MCLHVKYPLFLSDCKVNSIFNTDFQKYSNIESRESQAVPCTATDTQTDKTKLIVAFEIFHSHTPKKLMVYFSNQRFYPHFIFTVLVTTDSFNGNNTIHCNTGQNNCTTVLTGWVSLISLSKSKWYFSILCIGTESMSRNLNLPLLASFWHLYNNKQMHVSCNILYA